MKSILTGALVFGAATVPAGVVVTDLATDSVPTAPGAITAEAPALVTTGYVFDEPLVSAILIPFAPAPVSEVEEPRTDGPDLALEDAVLIRVSIVPPAEATIDQA